MPAVECVDQLRCHAYAVGRLADAPFEHIAHAEFFGHGAQVDGFALIGERTVSRNDKQFVEARQLCNDVFGNAVGEVILLRVAAHIDKGQYRNGRLVRERQVDAEGSFRQRCGRGLRRSRHSLRPHPERADWFRNVLHGLFTLVLEGRSHLAAYRAAHRVRDRNAAYFGQAFEACRDVDAIAIDGAIGLLDHVAQMHADAKAHTALIRE